MRYKSAFDAIADTPQEALNMKLRAKLMGQLVELIDQKGWKQAQAAEHLGITQPRVSDLLNGKLSKFSLDTLVNMVAAIGSSVEVRVKAV